MTTNQNIKIKRALISVSDKSGLEKLACTLANFGVELVSSGGTGTFLKELGLNYTPIEKVTGNPEAFGGRMKTLSFQVGSALLFRRDNATDLKEAEKLGIKPIDLVVCNLYPFEETAKKHKNAATEKVIADLIEHIDVGGPTMIRAAAKNYASVCVATNPAQYTDLIASLEQNKGATDLSVRQKMALEALRLTANYDAHIASELEARWCHDNDKKTVTLVPSKATELRYGENPHQKAWVYTDSENPGLAHFKPVQGKELSYNNLLDADAAWRANRDLHFLENSECQHSVVIVKHLNPCGAAKAGDSMSALTRAWASDPVSAFGGIVSFNGVVDRACAQFLNERFVEIVIAKDLSPEARELFAKKKNLRVILTGDYQVPGEERMLRSISGGWLLQTEDQGPDRELQSVTKLPFPADKKALGAFGIMVTKHLRSNAIALVARDSDGKGFSLLGAGMGNPNRLISLKQAVEKARENGVTDLRDVVLISDAFFPFADNIELANSHGIRFVIQPGGSIKDNEVIAACDQYGISMAFTGRRHFRH